MPPKSLTTVGMAVETTVISSAAMKRLRASATVVSGRCVFRMGSADPSSHGGGGLGTRGELHPPEHHARGGATAQAPFVHVREHHEALAAGRQEETIDSDSPGAGRRRGPLD